MNVEEIMQLIEKYGRHLKDGTRALSLSTMARSPALSVSFKHDAEKHFRAAAITLIDIRQRLEEAKPWIT